MLKFILNRPAVASKIREIGDQVLEDFQKNRPILFSAKWLLLAMSAQDVTLGSPYGLLRTAFKAVDADTIAEHFIRALPAGPITSSPEFRERTLGICRMLRHELLGQK